MPWCHPFSPACELTCHRQRRPATSVSGSMSDVRRHLCHRGNHSDGSGKRPDGAVWTPDFAFDVSRPGGPGTRSPRRRGLGGRGVRAATGAHHPGTPWLAPTARPGGPGRSRARPARPADAGGRPLGRWQRDEDRATRVPAAPRAHRALARGGAHRGYSGRRGASMRGVVQRIGLIERCGGLAETVRWSASASPSPVASSVLSSPLSSRARRSLPLRRRSTPSARRRSATSRLRRGSHCR
jgi:hypothetical protein